MTKTQQQFRASALRGRIGVPGDKSISHRALILLAKSPKAHTIRNLNPGRDVAATIGALRAIGASIVASAGSAALRHAQGDTTRQHHDPGDTARQHHDRAVDTVLQNKDVIVQGGALHDPSGAIDCMNSGSTARMMMGVCAGANLRARFEGDESLQRRPMEPVAAQLRAFGARIETSNGTLPASLEGTAEPQTRRFILITPSAQIKTALLLAGVFADVPISTLADKGSRDHTERLLRYFGADVSFDGTSVEMRSMPARFKDVDVPGDFSAAAFFIVAATIAAGSSILIENVCVNSTRTGLLEALMQMGADIRLQNPRERCGEHVADIAVKAAPLRGTAIGSDVALRAIDEIPVLAVAAAFAQGETRITGVRELRTKESDRVAAIERLLTAAGISVESLPNGIAICGGTPRTTGGEVVTHGDHRTAMAAAVMAAGAGALAIDDVSSVEVSFPGFVEILDWAQHQ